MGESGARDAGYASVFASHLISDYRFRGPDDQLQATRRKSVSVPTCRTLGEH